MCPAVLKSFRTATQHGSTHYRAWHAWAIANFTAAEFYSKIESRTPEIEEALAAHVVPAVNGFFRSISLGSTRLKAHILQVHDALWQGYWLTVVAARCVTAVA